MIILTVTHGIKYADNFGVEEEWWVASPPGAECAMLRVSYAIRWYRDSMFNKIIKSHAEKEIGKATIALRAWFIGDRGLVFKEKRKPKNLPKKAI
jgi:hypothetical protein